MKEKKTLKQGLVSVKVIYAHSQLNMQLNAHERGLGVTSKASDQLSTENSWLKSELFGQTVHLNRACPRNEAPGESSLLPIHPPNKKNRTNSIESSS